MSDYPFITENTIENTRLYVQNIPDKIKTDNIVDSMYPHVSSKICAYMPGVNINEWSDAYECLYVWCCDNGIPNMIFIWSDTIYKHYKLKDLNWLKKYPVIDNFNDVLLNDYNLGSTINITKSIRETLLVTSMKTLQIHLNEKDTRVLPKFNSSNQSAMDVIKENNLNIFILPSDKINLSKNVENEYVSNIMTYATSHKIKAVVFEPGKLNKNSNIEISKQMLLENIVNGIRGSIFHEDQHDTAKFLLKPGPIFGNFYEYINFCIHIKNIPDVAKFFSSCIDTKYLYQNGYSPYQCTRELLNYSSIDLIVFDNLQLSRCPWIYHMKLAQLCKILNIPILTF